jgi:hypothetical protein
MQWGKKEKETKFDKKNYYSAKKALIVYVADPIKCTKIKTYCDP